jgi:hypothetical protein
MENVDKGGGGGKMGTHLPAPRLEKGHGNCWIRHRPGRAESYRHRPAWLFPGLFQCRKGGTAWNKPLNLLLGERVTKPLVVTV